MPVFYFIYSELSVLNRLYLIIKSGFLKIFMSTLSLIFLTGSILAFETDTLFKSDEIVNIELRTDFSAIQRDRAENPVYHNGELIYYTPGGEAKKLSVKVMARGNFRRNPVNCTFPPLSLNFMKSEVKNTIFDNQDKLKLVTPCQDDKDVIFEYIIYKMYNQVTDFSMKVRLVKILFFDTGSDKEVFRKYSFFIEEKEHVAERNNSFEKDRLVTPYDLDRENVKKMSVFEYIIGNTDWYFTSRHNLVILQPDDTSLLSSAVPYDFDFSGFVDADYTKPKGIPDKLLDNRHVYKGICYTIEEFNEIFEFYRKLRPTFESIINNMDIIPKHSRKQCLNHLKYFYTIIESSDLIKQQFLDVCESKKSYNIIEK
jgi:hypothetical protein